MVHTQFDAYVKSGKTNNGSEFLCFDCQNLFTSLGIVHQQTCPYTPQQNGVAEREHCHLLQIARSILFQSTPCYINYKQTSY